MCSSVCSQCQSTVSCGMSKHELLIDLCSKVHHSQDTRGGKQDRMQTLNRFGLFRTIGDV